MKIKLEFKSVFRKEYIMEKTLWVSIGKYTLPKDIVDSADLHYIRRVIEIVGYIERGLVTEYEALEMILKSHVEWTEV